VPVSSLAALHHCRHVSGCGGGAAVSLNFFKR
jgi:hypothetical protein